MARSPSKRCFLCELHTGVFVANSRETVRVMGVIIAVEPMVVDDQRYPDSENDKEPIDLCLVTLDDGTATVDFWAPRTLVQNMSCFPGELQVDMVARLRLSRTKRWYTVECNVVTDPHAEVLRWMEASHPPGPDMCRMYGYPAIKSNMNEAYRLISVRGKLDGTGVSLEDLALVLDTSKETMQGYIHELQITGQIYQNEEGLYVPL